MKYIHSRPGEVPVDICILNSLQNLIHVMCILVTVGIHISDALQHPILHPIVYHLGEVTNAIVLTHVCITLSKRLEEVFMFFKRLRGSTNHECGTQSSTFSTTRQTSSEVPNSLGLTERTPIPRRSVEFIRTIHDSVTLGHHRAQFFYHDIRGFPVWESCDNRARLLHISDHLFNIFVTLHMRRLLDNRLHLFG